MTEQIESEHDERFHKLHHDILNCLHAISMGVAVLKDHRNDDAIFAEFSERIREQRKEATELLDEFLKAACQAYNCPR